MKTKLPTAFASLVLFLITFAITMCGTPFLGILWAGLMSFIIDETSGSKTAHIVNWVGFLAGCIFILFFNQA